MSTPPIFDLLRQGSRPTKLAFARQLRRTMTRAELALWKQLRGPGAPVRIRRQVVIAGYIADFYCTDLRLVIEVDGPIHEAQRDHDLTRDQAMERLGLHVIRLTNEDVLRDPPAAARWALAEGRRWLAERMARLERDKEEGA